MLDIQIRCATENEHNLDDVMRERFIRSRQLGSFEQDDFVAVWKGGQGGFGGKPCPPKIEMKFCR